MSNEIFTYCTGYKCTEKEECLRWKKHRELMDNKADTRREDYVNSELCVKHNHTNFVPVSVYGDSSGTS